MNKPGTDGVKRQQTGTSSTDAYATQHLQQLCQEEVDGVQYVDEPVKPINFQDNGMPNWLNNKQMVGQYMLALDRGDADAIYEMACCCLDGSASNELVQQISCNKTFKAKLYQLARNYALGFAEPSNDSEAFQLFKHVEDQNDPDVLCAIGRAYQFGWGVEKHIGKAIQYQVRAADYGSYEAMERLRECKNKNADSQLKAAFEHFKQQADAGNANAKFAVAFCYYHGIGVDKNYQLASEMCQAAEKQKNVNAMILLSLLYIYGDGVKRNPAKAFKLYKQAADAGNREGQLQLGRCYNYADGVAKDQKQAMFWYEKAAAQGHEFAAYNLGYCYEYEDGVEKDMSRAFQYYKQTAIAGNVHGQYIAANCYKNGEGVKRSYERAAYWYQKAADQEYPAKQDINYCFEQLRKTRDGGTNVLRAVAAQAASANQQHVVGLLLVKLAAELGCSRAFHCLGDCYYNGMSTARDFTAAAKCYERAEPLNSQKYLNLVRCLETGEVIDKNEIDFMHAIKQANTALRKEINEIQSQMR